MNKWIRNIIILAMVLAASVALNIVLNNLIGKGEESIEANQTIYISNYSVESVDRIEVDNQFGQLALILEDDIWYAQGYDVQLDQGVVWELVYFLTHIVGERQVSDRTDTADLYGMQNPSATITTYHNTSLEETFTIGNKAPIENEYYLRSTTFKKVYTVDILYYTYGQIKLEDLMVINGVTIEHADIRKIDIVNFKGEEYTISRTSNDNDISLCYWEFIEPFNHDVDTALMYGTDKYEGFITHVTEVSGERIAGNIDKDGATYGIDNQVCAVSIHGTSNQYESFVIADYGDEKYYSMTFADDKNIYLISKDRVPFVGYGAYIIAESNLALINIDAVDSIKIDLPDLKTEIEIEHPIEISIDILDEDTLTAANIDEQKIWFYQQLATIKIDDLFIKYEDNSEKIGRIEFYLNSDYQYFYSVDLYGYSQSHYIAKKNGEDAGYLINKKEIEQLTESFELLLMGQLSIDY